MKINKIQSSFLPIAILFICLHTTGLAQNDTEAIKNVIIAETEHYFAKDLAAWKSCYLDDKKTAMVQKLPKGQLVNLQGLDDLVSNAKSFFEANEDFEFKILKRFNWNISIKNEVAWVNFKETQVVEGTELSSEEIRVLVKEEAKWKIAFISSIY
jgi:hypothetical protein